MDKRLYRSRDDRMISGVCGGIAEYFDLDPTVVRLAAVALLFVTSGAVIVVYIIMAIVVPEAPAEGEPDSPRAMTGDEISSGAQGFARDFQTAATKVADSVKGKPAPDAPAAAPAGAETPAPEPAPTAGPAPADAPAPGDGPGPTVAVAAAAKPAVPEPPRSSTSAVLIGLLLIAFGLLVFWQRSMGVDQWGWVAKLFIPGIIVVLGILILVRGFGRR